MGEFVCSAILSLVTSVMPLRRIRASVSSFAAPSRMKLDTVQVFAISKLSWIKQQQKKLIAQERETSRDYVNRESHYVWGKRMLLTVVEKDQPPSVTVRVNKMTLSVRPGTDRSQKQDILERWYRERRQLLNRLPVRHEDWEY